AHRPLIPARRRPGAALPLVTAGPAPPGRPSAFSAAARSGGRPFRLSTSVDVAGVSTEVDTMSGATDLAARAGDRDPRVGLRAGAARRRPLGPLRRVQGRNARHHGR